MRTADLTPISVSTLQPMSACPWDLYMISPGSHRTLLYCTSDVDFTQDTVNRLHASGITKLYLERKFSEAYQEYLRENVSDWLVDSDMPIATRTAALSEVMRDVLSNAFVHGNTENIVNEAEQLGRQAAELMASPQIELNDLAPVLHHDYATFTHSVNVCYYAVMLGRALGYGEANLQRIATGGLLHDIGKLEICRHVLARPGRLTERERRQIHKHPTLGFSRLCLRNDVSLGELMMVYQHHERLDGRGYPVGVEEDEIHPWARICTVVDVFEALTSYRPYRQPLAPQSAVVIMERELGKIFDPEMFTCWKNLVLQGAENSSMASLVEC